jgi:hypothetical protein
MAITLSGIIFLNPYFVGNKPNGVESNLRFYNVEALHPFFLVTLSKIIIF